MPKSESGATPRFRLKKIQAQNYACFEKLELEFPAARSILLLGENGAGKTRLLDAVFEAAYCLAEGYSERGRRMQRFSSGRYRTHLRKGTEGGGLKVTFSYEDQELVATAAFESGPALLDFEPRVSTQPGPIVIGFSSNRLVPEEDHGRVVLVAPPDEWYAPTGESPAGPDLESHSLAEFKRWLVSAHFFSRESWGAGYQSLLGRLTSALRRAWPEDIDFSFAGVRSDLEPLFGSRFGTMALEEMPSGMLSLMSMIGACLTRLEGRPWKPPSLFDSPLLIVVDEIELHLHPRWQQTVLPGLLTVFPNAQVVASTHSPLVVGTCDPGNVFVLTSDRGHGTTVTRPESALLGSRAEEILKEWFGLKSTRDRETSLLVEELHGFMEGRLNEGDRSAARIEALAEDLRGRLPEGDPVRSLIDLVPLRKVFERIWSKREAE